MRLGFLSVLVALCFAGTTASADTLDQIKKSGVVKIADRTDAPPYSFKDAVGEPSGYTVDLCRAVAVGLKAQLGLEQISIDYVPVSTQDRFKVIQDGAADMLCGATTATLSRRELVDFSVPVFVDGASVLFRTDGPRNFEALAGKKIGVRANTTTEEALGNTLKKMAINAEVIAVSSHDDGLNKLASKEIEAYFADQAILLFLLVKNPSARGALSLSNRFFTHEPYAIGLRRGDSDFRLAVDRALSRIYRSGKISGIFKENFGTVSPSDMIKALFIVSAMPE